MLILILLIQVASELYTVLMFPDNLKKFKSKILTLTRLYWIQGKRSIW